MSYRSHDADGTLRVWMDDDTRTYHEYDENGVEISSKQRAYTAAENAQADAIIAQEQAQAALEAQRAAVKLIVTDLKAEKDRVQPIIDKDNSLLKLADVKDVARAAKRIADAAIDIAKLLDGRI